MRRGKGDVASLPSWESWTSRHSSLDRPHISYRAATPSITPRHLSHGPLPRPLVNSSIAMAHVCQRALGTRGKLFFVAVARETSAVLAV